MKLTVKFDVVKMKTTYKNIAIVPPWAYEGQMKSLPCHYSSTVIQPGSDHTISKVNTSRQVKGVPVLRPGGKKKKGRVTVYDYRGWLEPV